MVTDEGRCSLMRQGGHWRRTFITGSAMFGFRENILCLRLLALVR